MGYRPDVFARHMVTRRSQIIAVVVPDLENPVFTSIVEHLHEELQASEHQMLLFLERDFEDGPHDVLASAHLPVDGVILTSATVTSPVVSQILDLDIPTVLLQRDMPEADVDRVMPDDAAGCRLAAEHLMSLGHRRIGAITGSRRTSSGVGRRALFTDAAADLGAPIDPALIREAAPKFSAARDAARSLLELPDRPTAVFCASDTIALTLLDIAREMGIAVPRELSVVGYDDIPFASWPSFALTTVRQDLPSQTTLGLNMLLERIDGLDTPSRSITSPVQLITRASTAAPSL